MSQASKPVGPNLAAGIRPADVPEGGTLGGHVGDENVVLARLDGELYAVSAKCTHYGGPLHEGLLVGETLRCPWHHARFSAKTGAAVGAPALNALGCWRVERENGRVYVRERMKPAAARPRPARSPDSVAIVGGGAAGEAAAETLRSEGYTGPVAILSDDTAPPCDRPNLSKDYLAGTAKPSWLPLRGPKFYREHEIELRLGAQAVAIDPNAGEVKLADGDTVGFGALLLATGAEPVRLRIPGADLPHVHYLRTLADSDAIIGAVEAGSGRAVVLGASFIGLEVAASLRRRGVDVHVVAPDARPLERVMGPELGDFVRALHESKGVVFHLRQSAASIEAQHVLLANGERLAADFVVAGIGVRPRTELAEASGLNVDDGVLVDEYLQTSTPNVYAAGDIARWPDPISGARIRVEHWVVAQRQGQAAARNMLGAEQPFAQAPFFWSQHYDAGINYVGHAARWDRIETDGNPSEYDFTARFFAGDRVAATATIYRDVESLRAEAAMEALAAG